MTLPLVLAKKSKWMYDAILGRSVSSEMPLSCGVVLLSYQRAPNVEMIARAVLKCNFVDRLVISNNNPSVNLRDWVKIDDPRLTLVEQSRPTRQGVRLELLAELASAVVVVTIDDDRFLSPDQIRQLAEATLRDPNAPHGFEGERRRAGAATDGAEHSLFEIGVSGMDVAVDTLTGGYFLTVAQARRALEIARALGITDLGRLGNGEDLIMSRSGSSPARVHDVGRVLECWSTDAVGIATWRQDGFFSERMALRERLDGLAGVAAEPTATIPARAPSGADR